MNIVYAKEFVKALRKLPVDIQRLFSFRITRVYRVLFVFIKPDTVLFATIGHRKAIYR